MKNGTSTADMSNSDIERYNNFYKRSDDKYYALWEYSKYPPMHFNENLRSDFRNELKDARLASLQVDDSEYLDKEYKPFLEFEQKFSKVIEEAEDYMIRTNKDVYSALNLYVKDNSLTVHPDDMIPNGDPA